MTYSPAWEQDSIKIPADFSNGWGHISMAAKGASIASLLPKIKILIFNSRQYLRYLTNYNFYVIYLPIYVKAKPRIKKMEFGSLFNCSFLQPIKNSKIAVVTSPSEVPIAIKPQASAALHETY